MNPLVRLCISQLYVKRTKVCKFQYRISKFPLGVQFQNNFPLLIAMKNSLNFHWNIFVYPAVFGTTKTASFSFEKNEIHGNQFLLLKTVNFNIRENEQLHRIWYYVAQKSLSIHSIHNTKPIRAQRLLRPKTIKFIGSVFRLVEKSSAKSACIGILQNLSTEAIIFVYNTHPHTVTAISHP